MTSILAYPSCLRSSYFFTRPSKKGMSEETQTQSSSSHIQTVFTKRIHASQDPLLEDISLSLTETSSTDEDAGAQKKPKKVHFDHTVKVILIPTKEEFKSAKLLTEIWWTASEYNAFKASAARELIDYAKQHNCSPLDAVQALFKSNIPA